MRQISSSFDILPRSNVSFQISLYSAFLSHPTPEQLEELVLQDSTQLTPYIYKKGVASVNNFSRDCTFSPSSDFETVLLSLGCCSDRKQDQSHL